MVKPTELRLGNKVYERYTDLETGDAKWHIIDITHQDIVLLSTRETAHELYKPIPLTPAILEACGFDDNEYSWEKNGVVLSWASRVVSTKERLGISVDGADHINNLHLLQNYVFFKTGEELDTTKIK